MITQRRIALAMLMAMVLLSNHLVFSQAGSAQNTNATSTQQSQGNTDQDIDLLRKDVRSQKKQMIAANMNLTDAEAVKFWPVYDQYTAELVKINDKKYATIKDYAQNYDTLTDDQAMNLTKQVLEVDESVAQLRQKYIPIFAKVLPGKKTALFFQLDRRLVMLIDLQLSAAIPLVQQQ
jgi:hypothetical protein